MSAPFRSIAPRFSQRHILHPQSIEKWWKWKGQDEDEDDNYTHIIHIYSANNALKQYVANDNNN